MSLMDRDWYRAELARRQQRSRRGKWWRALRVAAVVTAVVPIALAILPVAFTSRCDVGAWQTVPSACWGRSWAALSERVAGNMRATRGWPLIIVRVDR